MANLYRDTYANIPVAGTAGDLFKSTDGPSIYRDDGAAWVPWGDTLYQCVQPDDDDFSWLNQGGASTNQTYGPIYLFAPGGAVNIRARVKLPPDTPYTVTALLSYDGTKHNYSTWGLCFYEPASNKLVTFEAYMYASEDRVLRVSQWNTVTSFNSSPWGLNWLFQKPMWFQIEDDGTNINFNVSVNGQDWRQVYTQLRGAFFTMEPKQVGFFVNHAHASAHGELSVLSWEEA